MSTNYLMPASGDNHSWYSVFEKGIRMSFIETTHCTLYYEQTGSGPDIVWIPGGDNRGEDWRYQVDYFKSNFRNTTYDPRGIGQTQCKQSTPWEIKDFALDCAELIRQVCDPPVSVAGLSMGSLVTLQLAVDYPELVRCAIPMGTAARFTGYTREWMQSEVDFRRAGGTLSENMAVAHYGVLMYPPEVLADEDLWSRLRPFVAASYGERDGDMLAAQWEACVHFDVYDELADCPAPIHAIGFGADVQAP
ncbi:alpha/beta hydrolase [Pseudohaliea sp.]|uniref:alpha/beta fold hydrolase n=1 Tax=Pseudohaliea sp. TaxID=2740289 RepID=UPI0032EC0D9E